MARNHKEIVGVPGVGAKSRRKFHVIATIVGWDRKYHTSDIPDLFVASLSDQWVHHR
jgi:hypothetical protein